MCFSMTQKNVSGESGDSKCIRPGLEVIKFARGSSVVRHLPLVLEVPGSIPARGEENFGVRTRFL